MTGHPVAVGLLQQHRLLGGAALGRLPAARAEAAARGRIERARHIAFEHDAPARALALGVGERDGGQQCLTVGMHRAGVEISGPGRLDDPAEIHHGDAVRDVAHDREVVGDEQERETEPLLQLLQKVEHARLNRHVEGRDGLVEHDDLGPERQRPCDADALALAAGKLVREACDMVRIQPHQLQQLGDPRARLALGQISQA